MQECRGWTGAGATRKWGMIFCTPQIIHPRSWIMTIDHRFWSWAMDHLSFVPHIWLARTCKWWSLIKLITPQHPGHPSTTLIQKSNYAFLGVAQLHLHQLCDIHMMQQRDGQMVPIQMVWPDGHNATWQDMHVIRWCHGMLATLPHRYMVLWSCDLKATWWDNHMVGYNTSTDTCICVYTHMCIQTYIQTYPHTHIFTNI